MWHVCTSTMCGNPEMFNATFADLCDICAPLPCAEIKKCLMHFCRFMWFVCTSATCRNPAVPGWLNRFKGQVLLFCCLSLSRYKYPLTIFMWTWFIISWDDILDINDVFFIINALRHIWHKVMIGSDCCQSLDLFSVKCDIK